MGKLSRRQFIHRSAAAGLGAGLMPVLPGLEDVAWAEESKLADEIPKRVLGKTGEKVSMICMGGHHIARIETEKEAIRLVHKAIDQGATFIDSAWDYFDGKSEEWIGKALEGGWRNKVFLMTKNHGRTADVAQQHLEDSLRRFKTDHLDLWQFHNLRSTEEVDTIFGPGGGYEFALKAREEGKVRFIGMTCHVNPEVLEYAAEKHGEKLDTMQFPINCVDPHFNSFIKRVIPKAVEKNIGILAMKTMAFGNIVQNKVASPADALRFVWSLPISAAVSGMELEEVFDTNLNLARAFIPMDESEKEKLLASTEAKSGAEIEYYKR